MGTVFNWVFGIVLVALVIGYPIALAWSIYEEFTKKDKSMRVSYKRGWTNKPWK